MRKDADPTPVFLFGDCAYPLLPFITGVQLAGGGGRSPLPFSENRRKVPRFCKKSALNLEKSALFVCIHGLNSHLKCSFKSILEKKH